MPRGIFPKPRPEGGGSVSHIKEEKILFYHISKSWGREMPVRLMTYLDNKKDLHCQTGDHHIEAIDKAREILWKQGLAVGPCEFIGGTGAYYPVEELKKP